MVSVLNASTAFDLMPADYRQYTQSIGSYPVIVCHKRRGNSDDDENLPKRRRVEDGHLDSESAAALTSLHSCTWGSWDSDMDIFDTLVLDGCDLSDSLSNVPDLSPLEEDKTEEDEAEEDEEPIIEPEAQKLEWYSGDQLLEHLMANDHDARVLTDMHHDTCGHEITQLSRYNPAYHHRMGYIDLIDPNCRYVTLRVMGHIAGAAAVHSQFSGLPGFALISSFMIRRSFRGQGLGTKLLEAVQLSACGQSVAILVPDPPAAATCKEMAGTSASCLKWMTRKGFTEASWDGTNPLAACSRLQLVLNGINYRDYHFLVHGGAAGPAPPRADDGALLRQYRVLKRMVMAGWSSEMEKILQSRQTANAITPTELQGGVQR